MSIYQSYIYSKDLSWLHSGNEPRIQERQKDQQSEEPISVAYISYPSSNWEHQPKHDNNIPCKGRFIEIKSNLKRKKPHRTNQGFNFLSGSCDNRVHVKASIQSSILKDGFSLRTDHPFSD